MSLGFPEGKKVLGLHENAIAFKKLTAAISSRPLAMVLGEGVSSAMKYPTCFELAMKLSGIARESVSGTVQSRFDIARSSLAASRNETEALSVLELARSTMGDLYFYDKVQFEHRFELLSTREPEGPILALPRFTGMVRVSLAIDHSLLLLDGSSRDSILPPWERLSGNVTTETPKIQMRDGDLYLLRGWAEQREKCLLTNQVRGGFSWLQTLSGHIDAKLPTDLFKALLGSGLLFIGVPISQFGVFSVFCRERNEVSYALLPDPGARDLPKIASNLSKLQIRPIWYPTDLPGALQGLLTLIADAAELPPTQHFWGASTKTVAIENPAAIASRVPVIPPKVPDDLVAQCKIGKCVLLAGSGLSARSGLPTWGQSIGRLIDFAEHKQIIGEEKASDYKAALSHDRNVAADNVYSDLANSRDILIEFVRTELAKDVPPSKAHNTLAQIPFSAVMTSNLDTLIEQSFLWPNNESLTPHDAERLLEALSSKRKFIVKLYGDWKRPETVIVSPAEYRAMISRDIQFTRFMEGIFFSRTLFFAGVSMEGLTDFLESFPFRSENPRRHYALVPAEGPAWRAKAQALHRRYNIEVLPYDPRDGHAEMERFLNDFAQQTRLSEATATSESNGRSRLTRVVLKNIGPFENLEIELSKPWKVLLGDNGVGKSTILKAIAVAIVGSDASPYAARLIRNRESMGAITLCTEKNPSGYLTEIFRKEGSEAEVVSKPTRPLEAEGWVALAFPPLRTVTWNSPSGPQAITKGRATPEDLLPLIRGEADPRMDKLKQWIINLDYEGQQRKSKGESDTRPVRILKKFFEIVNQITTGLEVDSYRVTDNYEVLVKTLDGEIPIEALSQGMTSLYSWVGILVQRMFEIHEQADDPSTMHGLVLMDEVDAHMHPLWQSTLVKKLRRIFPNVQMLVSTHSPLIVGGLEKSEIERYERGPKGKVIVAEIDEKMTQGRADQVLTSELFGLPTTYALTPVMEKMVHEYKMLLRNGNRSQAEESRFQVVQAEVAARMIGSGQSPIERNAHELVLAVYRALTSSGDGEWRIHLKEKADAVTQALDATRASEVRGGADA